MNRKQIRNCQVARRRENESRDRSGRKRGETSLNRPRITAYIDGLTRESTDRRCSPVVTKRGLRQSLVEERLTSLRHKEGARGVVPWPPEPIYEDDVRPRDQTPIERNRQSNGARTLDRPPAAQRPSQRSLATVCAILGRIIEKKRSKIEADRRG